MKNGILHMKDSETRLMDSLRFVTSPSLRVTLGKTAKYRMVEMARSKSRGGCTTGQDSCICPKTADAPRER